MVTHQDFQNAFLYKLETLQAQNLQQASNRNKLQVLAEVLRDIISKNWVNSKAKAQKENSKEVYYFSIEFLLGRLLESNLVNLGLKEICEEALGEIGVDLKDLIKEEEDAGLGNGGLGRLAACYLDSMASLGLYGHGMGIRYRYGLFEQEIVDGYQVEHPDDWLKDGYYIWEYRRPDEAVTVKFGGHVRTVENGQLRFVHENFEEVKAIPYDVPVIGYRNNVINTLRLWSADVSMAEKNCRVGDSSDCGKVIEYKHAAETISNSLYPDESTHEGKMLRLKQQYFLVSAGLQNILRDHVAKYESLDILPEKVAIHINDTHPALAIPELMRLLMDEWGMGWEDAWRITTKTISYTNHTVLPEALETWSVPIVQELLPRIFMIINEINERLCKSLFEEYHENLENIKNIAIIADGRIRMANMAIVGGHSVNGVARIHTEILKHQVMRPFYEIWPKKFTSVTNGITHRRWLMISNPLLTRLINIAIGTDWIENPGELIELKKYAEQNSFQDEFGKIKHINKIRFAKFVKDNYGITLDPYSIFDSHIKRIHAYKRQSLNVLHIMELYNRLRDNPNLDIMPRTFIFGGKAAFGYYKAKKTIKLINTLAEKINRDKSIREKIKVVFLENYNVSQAELVIPASDVSVQIPTASQEACGTGNMKFMMNGAVTIGTLDGANIEIRNLVGDDNIFVFGLRADQVLEYRQYGGYHSYDVYHSDSRVKTVMEQLVNGFFPVDQDEFRVHYDSFLTHNDYYFVLKDFASYVDAQNRLDERFRNSNEWNKMCLVNIACSGNFSSDRAFAEYAAGIWDIDLIGKGRYYWRGDYIPVPQDELNIYRQ